MSLLKTTRHEKELAPRVHFSPMPFQRDIDNSIEGTWRALGSLFNLPEVTPWPAIDVTENDKAVTLRMDAPGLDPKDIDVEISGNALEIRGSREEESGCAPAVDATGCGEL